MSKSAHLTHESALRHAFSLTETITLTRVENVKSLSRSCYGNVHQSSFFFDVACRYRTLRREYAFFERNDEHVVEFEPFHCVYGCDSHVIVAVHLVRIAHKRDRLHKVGNRRILVVLLVLLHRSDKFFDVFETVCVFGISACRQCGFKPASAYRVLYEFNRLHLLLHFDKVHCDFRERSKFLGGRSRKQSGIEKHLKKRHIRVFCHVLQFRNGSVAYAALWIVDDPKNAVVVARIYRNAHVCERVLNFFSFVKAEAAENFVRYAVQIEFFFKTARNRVCAHQNRHFLVRFALTMQRAYSACHVACFVSVRIRFVILDAVVGFYVAPKRLFVAVCVVFYDVVRRFENRRRASIVLFEFEDFRTREIFGKIENIANLRSAPTVNGLVFVPDDEQIAVFF